MLFCTCFSVLDNVGDIKSNEFLQYDLTMIEVATVFSKCVIADMWSIGVTAYILLCGSRPFWARTESGIFRAVLKAYPGFDETPWPSLSPDAVDFVKRLLNKDYRKRLTAAQALSKSLTTGSF